MISSFSLLLTLAGLLSGKEDLVDVNVVFNCLGDGGVLDEFISEKIDVWLTFYPSCFFCIYEGNYKNLYWNRVVS